MKKGNRVSVLDEKGTFIIKNIMKKDAILIDEHGFEKLYPLHYIINYKEDSYKIYEIENIDIKTEDISSPQKNIKKTTLKEIREIDLHIGHLVDFPKKLKPLEILNLQINEAKKQIEKARKDKIKKLILIHGKGKGILKSEIYNILKTESGIEYQEADIIKYKLGAVEIKFN